VEQGIEINVNTTESLSFETANGSQSKFIERISIKDLTEINENLSQYKIHGGYSYIESWTPFILEKDGSAKLLLVYKELRDIGGHGTIVDYYLTAIEIDDNNIRSLVDEDTYLGDEFTVKGITFSLQQPPKVYVVLSDEQIVEIYDVISSGNMITFVPIE
jgi:hypothetical protein